MFPLYWDWRNSMLLFIQVDTALFFYEYPVTLEIFCLLTTKPTLAFVNSGMAFYVFIFGRSLFSPGLLGILIFYFNQRVWIKQGWRVLLLSLLFLLLFFLCVLFFLIYYFLFVGSIKNDLTWLGLVNMMDDFFEMYHRQLSIQSTWSNKYIQFCHCSYICVWKGG